ATIKHKKAATDAKRGKVFSKLAKELTVAAKMGGGDQSSNAKLRMLVQKAKEANMPSDNVTRAIKKGTGELPGVSYEEQTYEGYGAGGVAIIVDVLTDNKNRTAAEIRMVFSKRNANMAGANAVAWMFNKKGYIEVAKNAAEEDKVFSVATEAGAEDFVAEESAYEITVPLDSFEKVKKALADAGIPTTVAEVTMLPQNTVKVSGKDAEHVLALVEDLEDHDDVQNVYANFDISDEEIQRISGS
ncbi:MAG TPA: YebC/PmpR family DNA-binding transcriptional regulator, partial [bacterium]|nr:YebC/PmpR family DNA-binding transcriptional regulator [bacterium]